MLKRNEALWCTHHASTLLANDVLFVTGDCVFITGGVLIHFDNELSPYTASASMIFTRVTSSGHMKLKVKMRCPINEIKVAVLKASVSLDFEMFMKHFYMWKEMTKDVNLPLPPTKQILLTQDALWNVTKHGSDTKTGLSAFEDTYSSRQSRSKSIHYNMQMNVLGDCWKGDANL
jgi:hypothetical protein